MNLLLAILCYLFACGFTALGGYFGMACSYAPDWGYMAVVFASAVLAMVAATLACRLFFEAM